MKGLLLSLVAVLVSHSAFAADVSLTLLPDRPIVINSDLIDKDGNTVYGPWFRTAYTLTNNGTEAVTIASLELTATSDLGATINYSFTFPAVEIAPGTMASLGEFIAGSLPVGNSFIYNAEAQFLGWTGGLDSPIDRLEVKLNFQTQ